MRLKTSMAIAACAALVACLATQQSMAQTTVQGVTPVEVQGNPDCNSPVVVQLCKLTEPVQLTVSPPKNNKTDTFETQVFSTVADDLYDGSFKVEVNVANNEFSFTDLSLLNGVSTASQQAGTPGVDAIIVGTSKANVYCRVNLTADGPFKSPANNLNQIKFCWSKGPCQQSSLAVETACDAFNTDVDKSLGAQYIQGKRIEANQPNNLCGCDPAKLAKFCDPNLPATLGDLAETPVQGSCAASIGDQDNLVGVSNESTAKTGDSSCVTVFPFGFPMVVCN